MGLKCDPMKKYYLLFAIIGFVAPNVFVLKESIESGNIMLWYDVVATLNTMFSTNINAAFSIDLLLVVVVFFVWTAKNQKVYKLKKLWVIWGLTMVLGLSGAFPLYLYLIEKNKTKKV